MLVLEPASDPPMVSVSVPPSPILGLLACLSTEWWGPASDPPMVSVSVPPSPILVLLACSSTKWWGPASAPTRDSLSDWPTGLALDPQMELPSGHHSVLPGLALSLQPSKGSVLDPPTDLPLETSMAATRERRKEDHRTGLALASIREVLFQEPMGLE